MNRALVLLLAACADAPSVDRPPSEGVAESAPPPPTLARVWTREEPHSTSEVALALPGSPPRALLYQRDPVVGGGIQIVTRVGNDLVTSDAPIDVQGLSHLQLGDVTGDGAPELILRATNTIRVIDPASWAVLYTLRLPSEDSMVRSGAWPVQVDADPELELLVAMRSGLAQYDLDGSLVSFMPHLQAPEIGQLDADPAPEALHDVPRLVLDGATLLPERVSLSLLGTYGVGPDLDGDGAQEVMHMGASDGELISLVTGATTPVRLGLVGQRWGAFLADARHDGVDELWVPAGRDVSWLILDRVTGQPLDAVAEAVPAYPAHYDPTVAVWDSDGDGIDEILYGGDDVLGLVDTVQLDWIVRNQVVVAGDLVLLDVDGDGQDDMIECSSGRLIVRDPNTAQRTGEIQLPTDFASYLRCQAGDIDGDGDSELAIGSLYETRIFDLAGGVLTEVSRFPGGGAVSKLADADGDGRADLVWANVSVCLASGALTTTWCQPMVRPAAIEVADLDGDGVGEVIVGTSAATSVLSSLTGAEITSTPTSTFALSAFQLPQGSFVAGASKRVLTVDVWVWQLINGQLNLTRTGRVPNLFGQSLRMDGPVAWIGGWEGVVRLDLRTGAVTRDDFGHADVRTRAVFLPQRVLMRVSDGWIAWAR